VICDISDQNYSKAWPHTDERGQNTYILNVVEKYNDIYIEVINCVEWKLEVTINARKIISTLGVPLENTDGKQ